MVVGRKVPFGQGTISKELSDFKRFTSKYIHILIYYLQKQFGLIWVTRE